MEFKFVRPETLASVWREIRDDVQTCVEQDTDDALIEDAYYFLKTGIASLYLCTVEDKYEGFAVIQRCEDIYSGRPYVIIWLTRCKHRENTKKCLTLIKQQAKASGCKRVKFKSTKEAFERLMKPLGFVKGETEYICEI